MSGDHLLAFNAVLLAALASPGAALLFALRMSVASGRAAGIATGIGLGLMAALWTLAALLGLDVVFRLFPWTYSILKIGGALYLLYLAWRTWRAARQDIADAITPKHRGRALVEGMLINLGNPKSMLFAAAVIVVIFPEGLGARDIALITLNHFLLEILFYSLFALLVSAPPARKRYLALKPLFDRIAALMLGGLGLRLLLQR